MVARVGIALPEKSPRIQETSCLKLPSVSKRGGIGVIAGTFANEGTLCWMRADENHQAAGKDSNEDVATHERIPPAAREQPGPGDQQIGPAAPRERLESHVGQPDEGRDEEREAP